MHLDTSLKFLKSLRKNNNKPWFDSHRLAYEEARDAFENFIQSVLDKHSKNDPDLQGLTARKSMFRINRDVRFSKNKSPYKSNFAASMDRGGKKSGFAGYYFHLEPGKSFLGAGVWMPEPAATKKIRQEIDYCFDEFNKIITSKKFRAFYPEIYKGEGIQLSRVPQGFEKDNPAGEYLKLKSWMFLYYMSDADLNAKDIVNKTVNAFHTLQPFIKFLNRAIEE